MNGFALWPKGIPFTLPIFRGNPKGLRCEIPVSYHLQNAPSPSQVFFPFRRYSSLTFISFEENPLLVVLLSLVVDDVVELELVDTLGGGDDTEPVTELLLLEELLGPVRDAR